MTKIVVAYYDQAEQAQQSAKALGEIGIGESEIGVLPANGSSGQGLLKGGSSGDGLVQELKRFGVPQNEARLYSTGIQQGGGFIIARVEDEKAEDAASVLDRQPVVDIETRAKEWGEAGGEQGEFHAQEGQTIQAVEEELHVGKRETRAGGVRIRSQVEERPVEETIRLREEEVHVERKPADREISPEEAEKAFQEKTIEVTATREQPVISKQARVVEEIVVGKSEREREEVVRDTVRRTKLEVEQKGLEKANS